MGREGMRRPSPPGVPLVDLGRGIERVQAPGAASRRPRRLVPVATVAIALLAGAIAPAAISMAGRRPPPEAAVRAAGPGRVLFSEASEERRPGVLELYSRPPEGRACERSTLIATVVTRGVTARIAPDATARAIATFPRRNPQGATQVFVVERTVEGADGQTWHRVLLPLRPNGTRGFVPAPAVTLTQTDYRLVVSQRRFALTLFERCELVKRYRIGLGKEATPTPVGRFYLVSLMRPPASGSVYGDWAYGLSAYSEAITTWRWGGVIGLHGTNDPSSIGKRESHGCIRMRNRDISQLVRKLPLGTPIRILPPAPRR